MINKIKLTNFKCFQELDLNLSDLTIFCGINGSGKSTIIQSILLLIQTHEDHPNETKNIIINGDIVSLGTTKDIVCESSLNDDVIISIDVNNESYSWNIDAEKILDYAPLTHTNADKTIEKYLRSIHYLKAERIGPRVNYNKNDFYTRTKNITPDGSLATHILEAFSETIKITDVRRHPNSKSSKLIDNVEAWLSEIAPNTIIKTNDYPTLDTVNIEYSSQSSKGRSNYYRSTNIGFGISYVLPIIVVSLIALPGETIIIDTPEAHLHPKGQVRIGELLANVAKSGVQVIIETHSDHILNAARISVYDDILEPDQVSVNYVERKDIEGDFISKHTSIPIGKDGKFSFWPKGFFDEWDASLDKLIQPKKIEE